MARSPWKPADAGTSWTIKGVQETTRDAVRCSVVTEIRTESDRFPIVARITAEPSSAPTTIPPPETEAVDGSDEDHSIDGDGTSNPS